MREFIEKARSKYAMQTPRVFAPPFGGSAYFGQPYRWEQVTHFKHWAFVAIRVWMKTVAGGPAPNIGRIFREEQGKGRKRVTKGLGGPSPHERFEACEYDDPMRRVFRNPNGPDVGYDLWAWHYLYLKLTGESSWYVLRNGFGVPVELWVIPTHWKRLDAGRHGLPSAYIVQSPWGPVQRIPFDDVVTFYEHSPLNRWEGYAVNQAVGEWIDTYESSIRSKLAQYKNGAIPAFHVQLGESYGDPDARMLERYRQKWMTRFQGENRTGNPLFTGADVDVKPLGITPVDMNYEATEDRYCTLTLAAYDVPKVMVGLVDSMTYGSVAAARELFYSGSVNPDLKRNGEVISEKIVRPTPHYDNAVCFWDEQHAGDPELDLRIEESMMRDGTMTPNQRRTRRGMEPYEHGGDDPLINGQPMSWATGERDKALDDAFLQAAADRGKDALTTKEGETSDADKLEQSAALQDRVTLRYRRAMGAASGGAGGYLTNGNGHKA